MAQLKVFASFDYERDEDLFRRLVGEGKASGSRFVVFDRSMKNGHAPEITAELKERISKVDAVIVLCGPWTHLAPNVAVEVKAAQELGKRYYLVKGRRFKDCARPSTSRITDKMFKWSRGVVDQLVLRNL